jgi:PAS domain S-box-containing protein
MAETSTHPAFGNADLSNCERELIHLAASIQPHGVLLVLDEESLGVLQVSANASALLKHSTEELLGRSLADIDPGLAASLRRVLAVPEVSLPAPFSHPLPGNAGDELECVVHRVAGQGLVLELEPWPGREKWATVPSELPNQLRDLIVDITSAATVDSLCELMARGIRELIGYDRVMVYRFDPDGHGEIVAEARETSLDPYLGLHYPASDIPQRARELYLRNRVRVLADVNYTPVPLVPRRSPLTETDLDMSLSRLRSMSPLHLQYLRNMGVTATVVTSLVKEGRLWGLVACHHYSPRRVPYEIRAGCELLSEMFSIRLAALDAQTGAQSEMLIRDLERQLVESVSLAGDWHQALFVVLRALLQPFRATGAALLLEGQTLTIGAVPSTDELNRIVARMAEEVPGSVFHSSALGRLDPSLAKIAPVASGALAIRLTASRLDYLVWFRKEQVQTVRWAGDPRKPMIDEDPNHLSPRRSFAVWTEQVRGTGQAWEERDVAIARMLQVSLSDSIQQVQAVRVLIASRQLASVSRVAERTSEPMVILDARDRVLVVNHAFRRLVAAEPNGTVSLEDLASHFADPARLRSVLELVRREQRPWAGELIVQAGGQAVPMAVRAEGVPGGEGGSLGTVVILTDLRERKEAEALRRQLAQDASAPLKPTKATDGEAALKEMMETVLANARLAVLTISGTDQALQPAALTSIQSLTSRAAELAQQMMAFASRGPQTTRR